MTTPERGRVERRLPAILTATIGRREFIALVGGKAAGTAARSNRHPPDTSGVLVLHATMPCPEHRSGKPVEPRPLQDGNAEA